MNCPRCQNATLDERDRNGLTIDVCPKCRGVWLDRGELEKLLAHAKRELEDERAYYGVPSTGAPTPPPSRSDDEREPPSSARRHGYDRHGRPHYKKRSWLDNLGDIFD